MDYPYADETYKIRGALYKVYKEIGCGFLEAVKELAEHQAQVINYLKASETKVGLLVNFGSYPKVDIKRLVYNY